MAHYREQIRKAVITAVTGLATTGARVQDSPVYSLADDMQPTLAVFALSTTHDYSRGQMSAAPLRSDTLVVEGYVKSNTDLSDTLDDIAAEVETAIYANAGVAALTKFIELGDVAIVFEGQGDKPVGKITLNFIFSYHAQEGAPTTRA